MENENKVICKFADCWNAPVFLFIGLLCGGLMVLVAWGDDMKSKNIVSDDKFKLIGSLGFGFKDAWNMPPGSTYFVKLEDDKYSKRFKFEILD